MEPELIIIKPAELFLKSKPVKKRFFKQLRQNIKSALKQNDVEFDYIILEESRLLVYTDEIDEALPVIQRVFGISKLSQAIQVSSRMETLKESALEQAKEAGTFRTFDVKTKRVYKKYPLTSVEISTDIRRYIMSNTKAKVEYKKPDTTVYIELLENRAFIYVNVVRGLGGLPIPVSGKVLALCDGSINSIVAAWLLLRRGCEVIPLHLRKNEREHTRFLNHIKLLKKFSYGYTLKPYSEKLEKGLIEQAEALAKEIQAKAIVFTTKDIKKLNEFEKQTDLPVFAPLLGFTDKELNSFKKIIQQT